MARAGTGIVAPPPERVRAFDAAARWRARARAMTTARTAATCVATEPSFVPRAPGVRDGPWEKADAAAVVASIRDADATAKRAGRVVEDEAFSLLGLTARELKEFAVARGMPAFRGKQIADHLYAPNGASARSVDDFTTLSKKLREELKSANVRVGSVETTSRRGGERWDGEVVASIG